MPSNPGQVLKVICLVLAAVVLFQIVRIVLGADPLARVTIPALPTLVEETPAGGQDTDSVQKSERQPSVPRVETAAPPAESGTNAAAVDRSPAHSISVATNGDGGNLADSGKTNLTPAGTNIASTNMIAQTTKLGDVRSSETDGSSKIISTSAVADTKTNSSPNPAAPAKTNDLAMRNAHMEHAPSIHPPIMPGIRLAVAGRPMPARNKSPLPPAIQARIDRITDSEILGPVIHPLPMALLGIAGDSAFLRAPSGQTGLVKEGGELGDIKLLQIGTNRVLIELSGEKKELTIFGGLGGTTLLNPTPETPHETNNIH